MPRALHVVATPIGNLGDLTFRAVEVLRACPVVAAEDTRRLRVLAQRYGFRPRRVVLCDERTEERAAGAVLQALLDGSPVALTSDAGTPGISDPGYRLVRAVHEAGLRVIPIPGACAPVAALSASGLATDRFVFAGFPPRRPAGLRSFLESLLSRPETAILLESPERVLALLSELDSAAPGREVVVARELTKLHEEVLRGDAGDLRRGLADREGGLRGEFVVLVAGRGMGQDFEGASAEARSRARAVLTRPWTRALSRRDLADLLSVACGLERNEAYRLAHATGETP
ncbi:MAG: 16S rRNA (cytidine(1402)-2'-O)-methyltransferase [Gemmatimonadota bacterium]